MFKLAQSIINKMDQGLGAFNKFNKANTGVTAMNVANKNIVPTVNSASSAGDNLFKFIGNTDILNKGNAGYKSTNIDIYETLIGGKPIRGQKKFLEGVYKANQDYFKATGKNMYLSSGKHEISSFRTYEQQNKFWTESKGGKLYAAAHPTWGNHPKGLAMDAGVNGEWKSYIPYLQKYNIKGGHIRNDAHHFEWVGQ